MFPTLDTYQNFVDQKLHLWHSHFELKYFDLMYQHQQATTESIKRLRIQVQKLLEEADLLQEQKSTLQQEIIRHLSNINKPELEWWLYNPIQYILNLQIPIIPSNPVFFIVSNVIALITENGIAPIIDANSVKK